MSGLWVRNIVQALNECGVLTRPVTDFGELLDIAKGRGEFCWALSKTAAWAEVTSTRDDPSTFVPWLQKHRLDTIWMRVWVVEMLVHAAAGATALDVSPEPGFGRLLQAATSRLDPLDFPREQREWLEQRDQSRHLVFFHWIFGEGPPDPVTETREDFLNRMNDAWDLRLKVLGWSRQHFKRDWTRHAHWFVQRRIEGRSVKDIVEAEGEDVDMSTVTKAIKSFAKVVELPADHTGRRKRDVSSPP